MLFRAPRLSRRLPRCALLFFSAFRVQDTEETRGCPLVEHVEDRPHGPVPENVPGNVPGDPSLFFARNESMLHLSRLSTYIPASLA